MEQHLTGDSPWRQSLPVIVLDASRKGAPEDETATGAVEMSIGSQPFRLEVRLPARPVPLRELLPVFQGLTDLVVQVAIDDVHKQGLQVSCRMGCGACCRQPVPVSHSEARALLELVEAMPEPRRARIRERFAEARRRLAEANLLDRVQIQAHATVRDLQAVAMDYFRLGIACPFLEDESCSIYPHRPLACREFLVTSPAENCSNPEPHLIRSVPLPAHLSWVLQTLDKRTSVARSSLLPLVLALDWAAAHPDQAAPRSGPQVLTEFLNLMSKGRHTATGSSTIADWIYERNLRPFLLALGWAIGTTLTESEWEGIAAGLDTSAFAADQWCSFELKGERAARVKLARDGRPGVVQIWLEVSSEDDRPVRLMSAICQHYQLQAEEEPVSHEY